MNNKMEKPKCIDLFSGCGGFTLGMAQAGFDVVGHVEFDNDALKTYEYNKVSSGFPNSELIGHDITKITDEEILKFKEKHGEIPVIVGGPPCQSFSLAGQRRVDDPRNNLFLHYVRFVKLIQPKAFCLENVPGLTSKKNEEGEFMIDVIREAFKQVGYETEYALINCADYYVPQLRRRIIIMGHKEKNKIMYPLPITFDDDEGKDKVSDNSKTRVQLKRCADCNKFYSSRVYIDKKTTVCMFCFQHRRNIKNNENLGECKFKEGWVVVPKNVPVPAKPHDFLYIQHIETRKTEEGETNFIYTHYDRKGVEFPVWKKPSDLRKVADNDEECDNAEMYVYTKTIGRAMKDCLEEEEDEEYCKIANERINKTREGILR